MNATLLDTIEKLDAALAGSAARLLLVFKHSLTCGTSAWAREELEELLADDDLATDIAIVHSQTSRPVSNAIAERSGGSPRVAAGAAVRQRQGRLARIAPPPDA